MPFVKRVCHLISTLVVLVDRNLSLIPYAHLTPLVQTKKKIKKLTPLVPKFLVICMKSFPSAILSWMLFVANI